MALGSLLSPFITKRALVAEDTEYQEPKIASLRFLRYLSISYQCNAFLFLVRSASNADGVVDDIVAVAPQGSLTPIFLQML